MSLFEELKRRNVFRVGIAYVVTAWLVLQVADIVLDNLPAPGWVMQVIMLVLVVGLPVVLVIAWAFELTPEGLKRERDVDRSQSITNRTGRKLDRVIIGALVLALGYFVWESRFSAQDPAGATPSESADLPAAGPGAAEAAPEKSIAVLPFVNLSSDQEQEYFSDGISEELLNVLAQYPGLHVAARTSSFQFKGQNKDIGEIARLLKVSNVLEGSVRKSGARLRITAQLIEADTGYHLWSQTYDREMDDVFAIQDEISAAIGDALRVELALDGDDVANAPRVAESANTAAYEAFLEGRHLVNQRGRSNMLQASEALKRAVRLDPEFAPAQAWMAIAWTMMLNSPTTYGDLTLAEVTERATPHVERALALNPNLPEAYGARGLLKMDASDYPGALADLAHALELNPVYVDAVNWSQIAASAAGEYARSYALQRRMVEIDPLSIIGRLNYAPLLAMSDRAAAVRMTEELAAQNAWAGYTARGNVESAPPGNLPEALRWYLKAYGADPHDEFTNRFIIRSLAMVGEYEEARRISDANLYLVDVQEGQLEGAIHSLRRAHDADPQNWAPLTELADALYFARHFDESLALYRKLQSLSPTDLIVDAVDASTRSLVRLAYDLQQAGDLEGAQKALALHRTDLEKRRQVGTIYPPDLVANAMARAMDGDESGAFDALREALALGLRDLNAFREPCFDGVAQHPEFLAIQADARQRVEADHRAVVHLICNENPIPDMWQPLGATCAGAAAGP